MDLISVIIPVYNVQNFLGRCVDSILKQTYQNFEVILVDDKSPDGSGRICDQYVAKDIRIKVIHKEKNEGQGFARNSGLDVATGKYVMFVDADDYLPVNALQVLLGHIYAEQSDVVFANYYLQLANMQFIPAMEITEKEVYERQTIDDLKFCFFGKRNCTLWRGIYNRNLLERTKLRFISDRIYPSEDLIFLLHLLKYCNKVVYVTDLVYYYVYNSNSLIHTYNNDKMIKYANERNYLMTLDSTLRWKKCVDSRMLTYAKSICLNIVRQKKSIFAKLKDIRALTDNKIWSEISYLTLDADIAPNTRKILRWLINGNSIMILFMTQLWIVKNKTKDSNKYEK